MKLAVITISLLLLSSQCYGAAALTLPPKHPRVVAFFNAVTVGNQKTLDSLLKDNPQLIDITDAQGTTALLKAVRSGNGELVEYLLNNQAKKQLNEALAFAVKANNLGIARTLYAHNARLTEQEKKTLASGPGAAILIELDLVMPPLPPAENEDGVPPPPALEGEQEIPAAPTTFEQHLAEQPKILTETTKGYTYTVEEPNPQAGKSGEKPTITKVIPAGNIAAYTFNPNDPWLKNLWSQYDTLPIQGTIENASISSDGNCVMIAARAYGYVYDGNVLIFTKNNNNQWSTEIPQSDQSFRLSSITMSATARRFVVRNPGAEGQAGVLETYTHNNKSQRWDKGQDLHIYTAADRRISGDGKRLVVVEKDLMLSVYEYRNNAWESILQLNLDKDNTLHHTVTGLKAISFDGTSIACHVLTNNYRSYVKIITLLHDYTSHVEDIEIDTVLCESVSISDDNNYVAIEASKWITQSYGFSIYKRQPNKQWMLLQKIDDVRSVNFNYNATLLFAELKAPAGTKCAIYQKVIHNNQETWQIKNTITFDAAVSPLRVNIKNVGNNVILFTWNKVYILGALGKVTTQEELAKLNANQLNFIRDMYEQDQVIKKSNNPNHWIILSPEDVTLFKTLPKATKDALRDAYKLTTQESIDAAQKKISEKKAKKDEKSAATIPVYKAPATQQSATSVQPATTATAAPVTAQPVAKKRVIKKKIKKKEVKK